MWIVGLQLAPAHYGSQESGLARSLGCNLRMGPSDNGAKQELLKSIARSVAFLTLASGALILVLLSARVFAQGMAFPLAFLTLVCLVCLSVLVCVLLILLLVEIALYLGLSWRGSRV
jgi:hypothetical protein